MLKDTVNPWEKVRKSHFLCSVLNKCAVFRCLTRTPFNTPLENRRTNYRCCFPLTLYNNSLTNHKDIFSIVGGNDLLTSTWLPPTPCRNHMFSLTHWKPSGHTSDMGTFWTLFLCLCHSLFWWAMLKFIRPLAAVIMAVRFLWSDDVLKHIGTSAVLIVHKLVFRRTSVPNLS